MEFLALSVAEVHAPDTEAHDLWVKASRPGAEYLKWQDLGRINTVDVCKILTNDPLYTDISSEESDFSPLVVRVMLIFRKHGIARRLGLGEVHLPKWLQLNENTRPLFWVSFYKAVALLSTLKLLVIQERMSEEQHFARATSQ